MKMEMKMKAGCDDIGETNVRMYIISINIV